MGVAEQTRLNCLKEQLKTVEKAILATEEALHLMDKIGSELRNDIATVKALIRKRAFTPGTDEYQKLAEANGQTRIKGLNPADYTPEEWKAGTKSVK